MTNTTDTHPDTAKDLNRRCHIAYTLNNEQPVLCSYISSEPMFYMDYEEDIEEDLQDMEFFDGQSFASSFYGHGPIETPDSHENFEIEGFFDNALDICKKSDKRAGKSVESEISTSGLENILRQSRFATALLALAEEHGTTIDQTDKVRNAEYDRRDNVIRINSTLPVEDKILLLSRELRKIWQHRNGALINPVSFYPDHAVLVNRSQVVDQTIMMIRISWELQLAGEKGPWERLEKSSLFDMTRSFARECHLDFRNLNNGLAASAAFETWFLSDRCLKEDRILIQRMLENSQSCTFDDEQSSLAVLSQLIYAIGSVPFGKNYLAPYVDTIIEDAIFSEVRDRSNANFLWFVKFERSFTEAEQHLQLEEDSVARGIRHEDQSNNSKIKFGDYEKTAQHGKPQGLQGDRISQTDGSDTETGDNIISLALWTSQQSKKSKSTQS